VQEDGVARKSKVAKPPQWWKHLREFKRTFWRRERAAYKEEVRGAEKD